MLNETVHQFGQALLQVILPSLATVIAGLLVGALKRWFTKQGIELTAAQEERLRQLAKDAIQAAEEQARRQKITSSEKHAFATKMLEQTAPEAAPARQQLAIDAMLPEVRADLAATRSITPANRSQFG